MTPCSAAGSGSTRIITTPNPALPVPGKRSDGSAGMRERDLMDLSQAAAAWRHDGFAVLPGYLASTDTFGFPPPGHDYWDETTLQGCAERYPNLDLTPWRAAVAARD